MTYKDELTKSMTWLSQQPDTVFIGQSVVYGGNALFDTLRDVPLKKRIELPVFEDCQLGMSIGLALTGMTVISIYPRMDFLIIAMNQLVNHLDKIERLSQGIFTPKVIIRTCIGKKEPLDAGLQHTGDYTEMLRVGLKNIAVIKLETAEMIGPAYKQVLDNSRSTILIERGDKY